MFATNNHTPAPLARVKRGLAATRLAASQWRCDKVRNNAMKDFAAAAALTLSPGKIATLDAVGTA